MLLLDHRVPVIREGKVNEYASEMYYRALRSRRRNCSVQMLFAGLRYCWRPYC